ncbi:RDD family protein [Desertifilum sp. FACHB-1129]|uniref:RDD domain-containing protein n=2 Tax=Desertifilum tharense IPPAS B-1220 TaxID=1781255 RepID=A0A1E5QIX5_9CYAN|nr:MULTISPECIES: RDD family protein [Desertifilum]MDA0212530.1 RDD family protein [Cyanobacteria bacterium FC1]MBD2314631.1 RDD family protein [Desertifilum sp. FACHB-1129]MBD2324950.1 RDD family protein [Desertifilum sp. FACHB-866]MBD2335089.1 RDD family protein [Desertifilum sp. FACHB-868]OEJ74625.1 hypothetical protein BH720_13715 [Desertifilum tharense IPPAS B-1220]
MQPELKYSRLPRVPLGRRVAAFAIDFFLVGIASSIVSGGMSRILFLLLWFGMRVFYVATNRGQSVGRYALDIKLVDARSIKIPLLTDLAKREGLLGIEAMLAWTGFVSLSPTSAWAILLMIPLAVDCGFAFADLDVREAFHDRIASTILLQSRRGYSLDLKVKLLLDQINMRMRK